MGKRRRKKHLPPFFDRVDNPEIHSFPVGNPVDITPPPPKLGVFDRRFFKLGFGRSGASEDFALMRAYPEVLQRIRDAEIEKSLQGAIPKLNF